MEERSDQLVISISSGMKKRLIELAGSKAKLNKLIRKFLEEYAGGLTYVGDSELDPKQTLSPRRFNLEDDPDNHGIKFDKTKPEEPQRGYRLGDE